MLDLSRMKLAVGVAHAQDWHPSGPLAAALAVAVQINPNVPVATDNRLRVTAPAELTPNIPVSVVNTLRPVAAHAQTQDFAPAAHNTLRPVAGRSITQDFKPAPTNTLRPVVSIYRQYKESSAPTNTLRLARTGSKLEVEIGATGSGGLTGSPVAASWSVATTAGSYLLALLGFSTTAPTITAPSGWSAVSSPPSGMAIYEIVNASSRSGSESFTLSASRKTNLFLIEVKGAAATSPREAGPTNTSGSNTTASLTRGAAVDMVIAWMNWQTDGTVPTVSAPTHSFTLAATRSQTGGNPPGTGATTSWLWKTYQATGSENVGVSITGGWTANNQILAVKAGSVSF